MIRSFNRFLSFNFRSINYHQKFNFSNNTDQKYLKQICQILNTKYFKFNEEIEYQGEIRLVDDKQRLLGFYDILDARKKARDLELDLVLINEKSSPAICKIMNYKDNLFKQFAKEIIQSESQKDGKNQKDKMKTLIIKENILMGDVLVKSNLAKEMAKKNNQLRVQMEVSEENMDKAKNILYTVKDQIKDYWICLNDKLQIQTEQNSENSDEDDEVIQSSDDEKNGQERTQKQLKISLDFVKANSELINKDGYDEMKVKTVIDSIIRQMGKSSSSKKTFDSQKYKHYQDEDDNLSQSQLAKKEQIELNSIDQELKADIQSEENLYANLISQDNYEEDNMMVNEKQIYNQHKDTMNSYFQKIFFQKQVIKRMDKILKHQNKKIKK